MRISPNNTRYWGWEHDYEKITTVVSIRDGGLERQHGDDCGHSSDVVHDWDRHVDVDGEIWKRTIRLRAARQTLRPWPVDGTARVPRCALAKADPLYRTTIPITSQHPPASSCRCSVSDLNLEGFVVDLLPQRASLHSYTNAKSCENVHVCISMLGCRYQVPVLLGLLR